MSTQDNTYKTTSLPLAGFLALYLPLESLSLDPNYRATFIFEETKELLDLVSLFLRDEASVNPTQYYHKVRDLKALIHERRNGE